MNSVEAECLIDCFQETGIGFKVRELSKQEKNNDIGKTAKLLTIAWKDFVRNHQRDDEDDSGQDNSADEANNQQHSEYEDEAEDRHSHRYNREPVQNDSFNDDIRSEESASPSSALGSNFSSNHKRKHKKKKKKSSKNDFDSEEEEYRSRKKSKKRHREECEEHHHKHHKNHHKEHTHHSELENGRKVKTNNNNNIHSPSTSKKVTAVEDDIFGSILGLGDQMVSKSAARKPSKPTPAAATVSAFEDKFDILKSLPDPNYQPPSRRSDYTFQQPGQLRIPKSTTNTDNRMQFMGMKFKGRTQVFAGSKTTTVQRVERLQDLCLNMLTNNIDKIYEVGDLSYFILKPVLCKCTVQQLKRIESYNPVREVDCIYWLILLFLCARNCWRTPMNCGEIFVKKISNDEIRENIKPGETITITSLMNERRG